MRLVSLAVVLLALGTAAFAQNAPDNSGVTILRGSSAPQPPPAAPAQTTVIQRDTIYQPVYVDPGYGYGYVGVGPTVGPIVNPPRRAPTPAAPAQSNVPNGWPLMQGGRR